MMETATMTLSEFLLARIAEDEDFFRRYDVEEAHRAWLLAECEAKRQIVGSGEFATRPIKILASVYADHPDYRDEWRP